MSFDNGTSQTLVQSNGVADSIISPKEKTGGCPSNMKVEDCLKEIIDLLDPVNFSGLKNRHKYEEFLEFWKLHIRFKVKKPGICPHYEVDEENMDNAHPASHLTNNDESDGGKVNREEYKVIGVELLKIAASEVGNPITFFAGAAFVFVKTHWASISEETFNTFLKKAMIQLNVDRIIAPNADFLGKVIRQFEIETARPLKGLTRNMINFSNGTLDISADGSVNFRNHDPDDLLRYALPFHYDEEADCEQFTKFLDEVIPEKEKQLNIAEFLGSCFSNIKHEKLMLLYGSGANGKSVILEIVTRVFGEDNIAHNTLEEITNPLGYYRGTLMDCLLNYAGEISDKVNPDAMKKLASREPMNARYVWGRPFVIKDYCRAAFNCNRLPEVKDNSDGYFRRFLIIHFAITVSKEKQNPRLPEEICETDLPGIMNWVIDGLQRLIKQNGKFTPSPSTEDILDEYRRLSNSVKLFVDRLKEESEKSYEAFALYSRYKKFCQDNEISAVSQRQFSPEIQKYGVLKRRLARGVMYEVG